MIAGMADDERDDPDRAAILARRQRFIAMTLSGLAASCGSNGGKPQPCLDIAPMTESADDGVTSTSAGTDGTSTTGMPMPCLDIGPMTSETGTTTGTDEATGTVDDTGSTDDTGTTGTTGG